MASVIVVEPNTLMRLGILQLLQRSSLEATYEGIDYLQLFSPQTRHPPSDLMLLAVPDAFDQTVELLNAALRNYAPKRILLLSETAVLRYSLLNLPTAPAGYLSKYAPIDVLTAAVSLVLAGGQCFPPPTAFDRQEDSSDTSQNPADAGHPRRRWYDKEQAHPPAAAVLPIHVVDASQSVPAPGAPPPPPPAKPTNEEASAQPPSAEITARESELLGLTPRQYEILVLLAQGHAIKNISRALNISTSTVKTHANAIYQRLAVSSRTAAVFEAVSRGAQLGLNQNARLERRRGKTSA